MCKWSLPFKETLLIVCFLWVVQVFIGILSHVSRTQSVCLIIVLKQAMYGQCWQIMSTCWFVSIFHLFSRRPASSSSSRTRPSSAHSVSSVSSSSSSVPPSARSRSSSSQQGYDVPDSSRSSLDSERSQPDSSRSVVSASNVEIGAGDPTAEKQTVIQRCKLFPAEIETKNFRLWECWCSSDFFTKVLDCKIKIKKLSILVFKCSVVMVMQLSTQFSSILYMT